MAAATPSPGLPPVLWGPSRPASLLFQSWCVQLLVACTTEPTTAVAPQTALGARLHYSNGRAHIHDGSVPMATRRWRCFVVLCMLCCLSLLPGAVVLEVS